MIDVDLLLTGALLLGAVGFLGWRLRSGRATPPCHPQSGDVPHAEVLVGPALARGMRGAHRRRRGGPGARQK